MLNLYSVASSVKYILVCQIISVMITLPYVLLGWHDDTGWLAYIGNTQINVTFICISNQL